MKRPKWEQKLNNLEQKFFLSSKQNPLPTERDILIFYWEKLKPLLIEFIQRNFVLRKKIKK